MLTSFPVSQSRINTSRRVVLSLRSGCQFSPSGCLFGATSSTSFLNCLSSDFLWTGPCFGWIASTPTASMARSAPIPFVSPRTVSTGSSRLKSIASAPWLLAMASREGTVSTAKSAPLRVAWHWRLSRSQRALTGNRALLCGTSGSHRARATCNACRMHRECCVHPTED